ncbi:MAG: hypothetical protein ABJA82_02780 [Myxococcales bacterium]
MADVAEHVSQNSNLPTKLRARFSEGAVCLDPSFCLWRWPKPRKIFDRRRDTRFHICFVCLKVSLSGETFTFEDRVHLALLRSEFRCAQAFFALPA